MDRTFNLKPSEARKKWAEALRGGKYKQGRSKLCTQCAEGEELFCCLGVACEVFMQHEYGLVKRVVTGERASSEYVSEGCPQSLGLPFVVRSWLGMTSCEGLLTSGDSLVTANDRSKIDFLRIADIVESDLLPKVNGFE